MVVMCLVFKWSAVWILTVDGVSLAGILLVCQGPTFECWSWPEKNKNIRNWQLWIIYIWTEFDLQVMYATKLLFFRVDQ